MAVHDVHDPADGVRIDLPNAGTVRLLLPQNATTGYVWRLAELGEGLEVLGADDVAGGAAPGAAGRHELRVRAVRPGTWPVRLVRSRPWEESVEEERRLSVAVS